MTRKKKLANRAFMYAWARSEYDTGIARIDLRAYGFEDGYRAAMRDLRKMLHEWPREAQSDCVLAGVMDFLKPLR